jgi:hypothetical protein
MTELIHTQNAVDPRITKIREIFKQLDPNSKLEYTFHDDKTCTIQGPFPSFMLMVDEKSLDEPIRALIHVNADAPNLTFLFSEFNKELDIEFDGAFAINGETGELLFNMDAYRKKEDNILMFAEEIKERRGNTNESGLIVPEEKKIILA